MSERFPGGSKISRDEISAARRHVFLCIGPDCCDPGVGAELWEHLKRRARAIGVPVLRTKAGCLRVCVAGPWLVVYPEGTWYGSMTPERLDRVLADHVAGGVPVAEWATARTGAGG